MFDNSEQWKLEGKCTECRRKNYCPNNCTAKRKRDQALIQQATNNAFTDKFPSLKRYL